MLSCLAALCCDCMYQGFVLSISNILHKQLLVAVHDVEGKGSACTSGSAHASASKVQDQAFVSRGGFHLQATSLSLQGLDSIITQPCRPRTKRA